MNNCLFRGLYLGEFDEDSKIFITTDSSAEDIGDKDNVIEVLKNGEFQTDKETVLMIVKSTNGLYYSHSHRDISEFPYSDDNGDLIKLRKGDIFIVTWKPFTQEERAKLNRHNDFRDDIKEALKRHMRSCPLNTANNVFEMARKEDDGIPVSRVPEICNTCPFKRELYYSEDIDRVICQIGSCLYGSC